MKKQNNTAGRVRELIECAINKLGYRVWDVEFEKEGADMYLRVTIDSDDGISINDCEKVHKAIDPILDREDPIEGSYILEVSSPGVERNLRTEEHFSASAGKEAELKLFAPLNGVKTLRGTIIAAGDGRVTIDTATGNVTVEKKQISKANTIFNFGDNN